MHFGEERTALKILILSVFPAPYRIAIFTELKQHYDVTIYFDRNKDDERNKDWFVNQKAECPFRVLNNRENCDYFRRDISRLEKYDLVICYDFLTSKARQLQRKCMQKHIPYIINADGALTINMTFPKRQIKSFYVKNAARCLAGCSRAKEYFLCYGAQEERVVEHKFTSLYKVDILDKPVGIHEKKAIREQLGIFDGLVAIAVGQFIFRKGFDLLLESWTKVNPDIHLYLIGGGEEQSKYERFLADNELKNVHIIQYLCKEVLFQYYKASDVFLMPTREDIWGLVVNEAMACGLPVVSSDKCVAGLELIEDGVNGYIVPCGDTNGFAKKIDFVFSNRGGLEKMASQALEKIRDYTYEENIASHKKVIDSLFVEIG